MERYQVERTVGHGAFGVAMLCNRTRDSKACIIKQIDTSELSSKARREAAKEATFLSTLSHPNIVGFWESFFHGPEKDVLCIVMDYADGGDLSVYLKARQGALLEESVILDWLVQITLALKHIHDRKIMHRDLKTRNVFLTQSRGIKLGDFGIAKVLASSWDLARTRYGTPYYMSPEMCQHKLYNHKSDMWSLGCVLYEMATLRHAFKCSDAGSLMKNICIHEPRPISPRYSPGLRMLLAQLLRKDPRQRPSTAAILRRSLMHDKIGRFLNEEQMREEFGNIVPSCRRPVKAAPPTPVSTVSVARSRGIGGRHASPICRRPVSPLAAAGCDGRVVSEAHRARQAGVEGAVGAAAIAATTDAGSEAPDGMSRPDCIEAGKAEGADSSLTLADGGGNVLRTGSGRARPSKSPTVGAMAAVGILGTPRYRVSPREARKAPIKLPGQRRSTCKTPESEKERVGSGTISPGLDVPITRDALGEPMQARRSKSSNEIGRDSRRMETKSAAKLPTLCFPFGPREANTPGPRRPKGSSPRDGRNRGQGTKAVERRAAVSPMARDVAGHVHREHAGEGVGHLRRGDRCQGTPKAFTKSSAAPLPPRGTDVGSKMEGAVQESEPCENRAKREETEANDSQGDQDPMGRYSGGEVASRIVSGSPRDGNEASAALDRFSSQTERDALDAEAVDTHLSVGSAAESTPAADESKPRSRSSDDASGSVLVDAAPNACQEEPRSSPSGDIQVRSESTATGGDENGRERGSPARRVSRFHRGPRGSWLPNLKAQMDAVKAKVKEIESTPTRRSPLRRAGVRPGSPAPLNRPLPSSEDRAKKVAGSGVENMEVATAASESRQHVVVAPSGIPEGRDEENGQQTKVYYEAARGREAPRADGRHVTPARTAERDMRSASVERRGRTQGAPCVFCRDGASDAPRSPLHEEKLVRLLETVAAVEKAAAAVGAVLTDSAEDEGTRENVGEPEPLDAGGTPRGPRNRDEDDVTSGEKDVTSQRLLSSPEGNIARALGLTNVVVNTTPAQRRRRRPTGLISSSPSRGEIGVKPFRISPVASTEVFRRPEDRRGRKHGSVLLRDIAGGGQARSPSIGERAEAHRDASDRRRIIWQGASGSTANGRRCALEGSSPPLAAQRKEEHHTQGEGEARAGDGSRLQNGGSTRKARTGLSRSPLPSSAGECPEDQGATLHARELMLELDGVKEAVRQRVRSGTDRKEQEAAKTGKCAPRPSRVVARRQRELRAFMAKGRRERRAQRQMRMRMEVDSGEQDPILVWMEVAKPLPPGDGLQDERERDTPGSRERPSQTWCWGPTPEKGRSPCVKRNLGREIEWQVKDSGDGGVERGVNGRMVPVRCSPVAAADHDHEGLSCGVPGAQQLAGGGLHSPLRASGELTLRRQDPSPQEQDQVLVDHARDAVSSIRDTGDSSRFAESNLQNSGSLGVGLDRGAPCVNSARCKGQQSFIDEGSRERKLYSVSTTADFSEDRIGAAIRSREKARELLQSMGEVRDVIHADQGSPTRQESTLVSDGLLYRANEGGLLEGDTPRAACVGIARGDERDGLHSTDGSSNATSYGGPMSSDSRGLSVDGAQGKLNGRANLTARSGECTTERSISDMTLCGLQLLSPTFGEGEESHGEHGGEAVTISVLKETRSSYLSNLNRDGNDQVCVTVDKPLDGKQLRLEKEKSAANVESSCSGGWASRRQPERKIVVGDRPVEPVQICKYIHASGVKKPKRGEPVEAKRFLGGAPNSEGSSEQPPLSLDVERGASSGSCREGRL